MYEMCPRLSHVEPPNLIGAADAFRVNGNAAEIVTPPFLMLDIKPPRGVPSYKDQDVRRPRLAGISGLVPVR